MDTNTPYLYRYLIDEVVKTIRKDMREEIDDTTLMIIRKNWEKKLNAIIAKGRECAEQAGQNPDPQPNPLLLVTTEQARYNKAPKATYTPGNYSQDQRNQLMFGLNSGDHAQKVDTNINPFSTGLKYSGPVTTPNNNLLGNKVVPPPLSIAEKRKISENLVTHASDAAILSQEFKPSDKFESSQAPNIDSAIPPYAKTTPPAKKPRVNQIVQLDGRDDEDLTDSDDLTSASSHGVLDQIKLDENNTLDKEGNLRVLDNIIGMDIIEPVGGLRELPKADDALKSEDDISDEDPMAHSTDNIMVCAFDKLTRRKNNWRMELSHGIINIQGLDLVFNKAVGEFTF